MSQLPNRSISSHPQGRNGSADHIGPCIRKELHSDLIIKIRKKQEACQLSSQIDSVALFNQTSDLSEKKIQRHILILKMSMQRSVQDKPTVEIRIDIELLQSLVEKSF